MENAKQRAVNTEAVNVADMATPGNPNTPGGATPFDMPFFFRPSNSPAATLASNPNPQNITNGDSSFTNPNLIPAPFPPPSASFPPPAAAGGGQYSYLPQTLPFHHRPQFHHLPMYSPPSNSREFANVHPQRSMSFPTPTLQPQVPVLSSPHHLNLQAALISQSPNTHGARLMALLSASPSTLDSPNESTMPMPQTLPTSSGSDFSMPQFVNNLPSGPGLLVSHQDPVMRMPSSKLPKGRHLSGDHLVYDIDIRLAGEVQPQLEVTPITKYGSDPGLVVGRQIAVNKTYICYGLKLGAIRVLNINTALRSLLKGLAQRVTDMAFFAEDVHLLASASVDGRVYVWKITEGPDEEDKQQITGRIVTAIQITGEGESVHPRVCWHCHKQEVLAVGIGKQVLKIDTTKVGKGEKISVDEPLKCAVDKLIDGIQLVGSHDAEVTDLSMCQWMTTRLVSASVDGTIKIWEDRNQLPIAVLQPHGGQPVSSVTFLAAPHRPDHIILITGGPLNREVKIWVSVSEEGWLLPINAESWHCTQTLELMSSKAQIEEAFFNQVIALSQAGLLLLANAKKNAIYVVHLEYGPNPAATRMDYIAEFTVTMRILSFTGTSESLPNGEQVVQVYCVQTQAIQQYALDLSQCLPPAIGNLVHEKSNSNVSREVSVIEGLTNLESSGIKATETSIASSAPSSSIHENGLENIPTVRYPVDPVSADSLSLQDFATSSIESKPMPSPVIASDANLSSVASPSLPLSPRLSGTLSGFRNPSSSFDHGILNIDPGVEPKMVEYTVDRQMDTVHSNLSDVASLDGDSRNYDNKHSQDDISLALNHSIEFRHPTHLVTPSEILMANSSSEVIHTTEAQSEVELKIQDVVMSNEIRNSVVEVKVVGETKFNQNIDNASREELQTKFVGETKFNQNIDDGSREELQTFLSENKERTFCSQAYDLGIEMAREYRTVSPETYIVEEDRQFDGAGGTETVAQPSTVEERTRDSAKDGPSRVIDPSIPVLTPQPASNVKGKKQKGKSAQGSGPSSPSPSAFNSADSSNEPGLSYSTPVESQIYSMQEVLHRLVALQKDIQKQMTTMIAVPVIKEGRRLEASLGRSMEKAVKANADALWARLQEENAKQEKASQERAQLVTNMISSFLNKDLPSLIEKNVKREVSSLGQSVARTIIPTIEKAISTSIVESFQKGVGDKAVNQLEKSVNFKLEAIVGRQIHSQFQTTGKQALQEILKSSLEVSVIPAFEISCRAMFEQVDSAFQKGMVEHTAAAQQQFEASHSSLALVLRDAITSATSMSQTLSNELLDGQRKLVALAAAGVNSKAANTLTNQLSNCPLGALHEKLEVDPTKELSRLVAERKYEEAFIAALHRSDVTVVSWLCSHVDLATLLAVNPLPLSQGVFLSLLQQLACDISKETPRKLTWMREVLTAINPADPVINVHVRPIFEQVYQIMNHHHSIPSTTVSELSNIRLIMHVINSMLMGSK
ncbi:enhancer of mRNA-decapping protein 4-like isoform X1 [Primulina huaijiensis]|uniref:enhancer of mRNA-decapping protein 4-like isoform X1 n=1 Tax=Primulina huaijiensis TaxID=1492673 RepID=UPI003CC7191A